MATITETLQQSPQDFLTPTSALHTSALSHIASALQPLAASTHALHEARTAAHRKRKRGQDYEDDLRAWDEKDALRLGGVYVDGFDAEQVWEQVRRVVEGVNKEVKRDLEIRAEREEMYGSSEEEEEESVMGEEGIDFEVEGVDDDEDARYSESEDESMVDGEEDEEEDEDDDEDADEFSEGHDDFDDEDAEDDEEEEQPQKEFVQDPNGLNDGFFSIDDFNKQSAFLEQADQRGDGDGAGSDEEEVDWHADLLGDAPTKSSKSKPKSKKAADEDSDEEDGPTFGNMDLNAPEGASDDEDELEGGDLDGMDDLGNANNIMYKDFFAPPAKKARPNKKGRPHPHNFPAKPAKTAGDDDEEMEDEEYNDGALSRVHRDLFSDDEDEDVEMSGDDEELPPSKRNLSSHEKRQLALGKEIQALEATLVSKKPWAMSGEASSSSRPVNSLLEEDLAFERTGKPVPVVTAEVSADLESLIKSRILALDFQDIARRRPDDLAVARSKNSYELSDAKSKKSLAELYEEDHLKATTGSDASEQVTDQQRKDQTELVNLWSEIRAQLDSLSNFSLRPKAPTVSLEIRTDVAAAAMEDARPAAAAPEAEVSRLAPTEIYRAGAAVDKDDGEVLMGGRRGEVVARDERERGDSKRARRRAKDRAKKRKEHEPVGEKKRDGEKEVRDVLKKGGVKVIGKKGEVTDVDGNKVREKSALGGGAYKL